MAVKNKQGKVTIDDLAVMVKEGFDELGSGLNKRIDGLEKGLNEKIDKLETGQEEIKMRLDNVAYRFELVELQKRVEVLERRIDMKRR